MKKGLLCSLLALGLLGAATSVSADTVTKNSSGKTFKNDWELSTSGNNWLMNYGYNTSWINEDYTHTTHSVYDHSATVSNSNGAYSDNAGNGSWAKIEVTHSGSFIQYSITF
ncbi:MULTISPECIES: hypothetical protein [Bacillus]|uniref:Lactococcin 972 family bacteriocin n=2 Tax=Bacillus cereus group TaxID=86661 RepID=A0A2B0VYZ4_BACAN|nr:MULTISPECIES: hypothetical protein [Bacillus]MCU0097724.1 hypothetical protein [Bacillus sp. OR9]KZD37896.1 hypothetical protein B4082_1820 [Bacillus cereus]MBJ8061933.1 hypothetical protein [Bacillus cereus]MCU4759647.1 hypothetical protein [Bacillus cereus]MCU5109373.1 hypothetical protein [Bacillus cereus]